MERLILNLVELVDRVRVSVLRLTLAPFFMRLAFYDRAVRNFLLFIVVVLIYLPLSLYFPLWVLAIGPIVWGLPHLFSSIRLQHRILHGDRRLFGDAKIKTTFFALGSLWLVLSMVRVATDVFGKSLSFDQFYPGLLEAVFSALTLGFLIRLYKFDLFNSVAAALVVLLLNAATYFAPFFTLGALVIGHNFVAFFYWIMAAPNRRERVYAGLATAVFTLVHILVFVKFFDGLINLMPSSDSLSWSGLSINSLGRLIAPWSENSSLWYRCVVLYAFGQAVHYFVWLKALPDIHVPARAPTSFKSSWILLKRDIGKFFAIGLGILCLVPLAVSIFSTYSSALQIYFAFASYHGYMEVAGLSAVFAHRIRGGAFGI